MLRAVALSACRITRRATPSLGGGVTLPLWRRSLSGLPAVWRNLAAAL